MTFLLAMLCQGSLNRIAREGIPPIYACSSHLAKTSGHTLGQLSGVSVTLRQIWGGQ